jgi:hypothetical protein
MAIFVKEDDADSYPKGENRRNPDADVKAVVTVVKKPKANAGDEANESSDQEVVVDFGEHGRPSRCGLVLLRFSRFLFRAFRSDNADN